MANKPILIVMLTHNDRTVDNAYDIFKRCSDLEIMYWGMKEKPLEIDDMKRIYSYMKECGKITVLEVVSYTEEECLQGAEMALECNCDILMGTLYFDSVKKFCEENNIRYVPFVGKVSGIPSVMSGETSEILSDAEKYIEKGVYGIDLLSYRYIGNQREMTKRVISEMNSRVCMAGSIDSYEKIDEVMEFAPWAFTIGSAFFDNKFGGTFEEQLNKVCEYIKKVKM